MSPTTRDHLRRALRFFGIVAAVPLAVGSISAWAVGAGFILSVLGAPALLALWLVGGSASCARGISAAKRAISTREQVIAALTAPALMVLTAVFALPLLGVGDLSGTYVRLLANRSHYEAIIAKARRSRAPPNVGYESDGGVEYLVDRGPPLRVAFNPAGLLDNWSGIIFDSTGEVMRADGFDPETGKFAAPDRITKLFGGDLVSCRRLWRDY